jgi:hypothetical protein
MEVAILVSVISNFSLLARISLSAGISYPGLSARISLYPRRRAWSTQLVSITQHKFFPIWYVITVWSDFICFRFRSFSLSSGFFWTSTLNPSFCCLCCLFFSHVFSPTSTVFVSVTQLARIFFILSFLYCSISFFIVILRSIGVGVV